MATKRKKMMLFSRVRHGGEKMKIIISFMVVGFIVWVVKLIRYVFVYPYLKSFARTQVCIRVKDG